MGIIATVKLISDALLTRDFSLVNVSLPSFQKMRGTLIALFIGFTGASALGIVVSYLFLPGLVKVYTQPRNSEMVGGASLSLKTGARAEEFKSILKRNIFNSDGQIADTKEESACTPSKSDLPLKFTGVIFGGTALSSLVLLEADSTKEVDTFILGDMVPGEAKVVDIKKDKVFFERKGCPEFLELQEPVLPKIRTAGLKKKVAAVAPTGAGDDTFKEDGFERSGEAIKVTREWVERALTIDFAKTLQDAKASPNQVGSEVKGFILTRIRPDSVYEKMGFQDGDIVEAINGVEMNDAARGIATLGSLRKEGNIEIQVRRGTQVFYRKAAIK